MEPDKHPFYPMLAEPGAQEAVELIEDFKKKMVNAASEAIGNLYYVRGLRNYGNRKIQGQHDFKAIRTQIYIEFRDDIIADLNQDHLEKIKELERSLEWERKCRSSHR